MNYIKVLIMSSASLAFPIDERVALYRRTNTMQQSMTNQKINYNSINPDENPIILSILLLSLLLVLMASIVIVTKLLEIERERPYDPELDFKITPNVGLSENKTGLWTLSPGSPSSNSERKSFFSAMFQHKSHSASDIDQKKSLRMSIQSVLSRNTTDERAEDAYNKLKQELVSDIEYRNRDSCVSEALEVDDYSHASYSEMQYSNRDDYSDMPNSPDTYPQKRFSVRDSKKRATTLSTFSVMTSDSLL